MTRVVQDQVSLSEMSRFAAEEFERVAALTQTLLELMQHPRFYSSPALVVAQLSTIAGVAEAAAATIDQMAAARGVVRVDDPLDAVLSAHEAFKASVAQTPR